MRRIEPHVVSALGAALVCASLFANPVGYEHLVPGGDTLESATVRGAAWLTAWLLCGSGLAFIRWRRSIPAANLLLLGATCVGCFVAAELALGALGVQPVRRLVIRIPPQVEWWTVDSEHGGRISADKYPHRWPINPQGFADRDSFEAKAFDNHAMRVLLLGDSFAFGVKASSFETSFSYLMESHHDVIVWNTGLPGTGQRRQLESLRTYFPLMKPDAVVVAFSMNDFGDNRFPLGQYYVFEGDMWVHRYQRQADGSVRTLEPDAAFRRAYQARNIQERFKSSRLVSLVARAIAGPPTTPARGHLKIGLQPGTEQTRDLLTSIRDYVREGGSRFLLVLIPRREELDEPGRAYRAAKELCEELDIDILELRDILRVEDYVTTTDRHWNDSGHRKVAQKLREAILKYE